MVEPLDFESRIWSERGTKPAPGDEIYRAGYQPIAGYDNWTNWSITTDLHNLRDQVGSLDEEYYPRNETYSEQQADDRFLNDDGDTAEAVSDDHCPGADFYDLAQIRNRGRTGLRLQQSDREVIFLSDAALPAGQRAVFLDDASLPIEERYVRIGSPAIPRVTVAGEELDLGGTNITDSGGTVRVDQTPVQFYTEDADGVSQQVAQITENGDLRLAGTVDSNYSF